MLLNPLHQWWESSFFNRSDFQHQLTYHSDHWGRPCHQIHPGRAREATQGTGFVQRDDEDGSSSSSSSSSSSCFCRWRGESPFFLPWKCSILDILLHEIPSTCWTLKHFVPGWSHLGARISCSCVDPWFKQAIFLQVPKKETKVFQTLNPSFGYRIVSILGIILEDLCSSCSGFFPLKLPRHWTPGWRPWG